jgi:hypothetical protein
MQLHNGFPNSIYIFDTFPVHFILDKFYICLDKTIFAFIELKIILLLDIDHRVYMFPIVNSGIKIIKNIIHKNVK